MTMLRTTRPLVALFAFTIFSVGCADDEEPIGDIGGESGESGEAGEAGEAGDGEEGEGGEGGEELEACMETITVLADLDAETPEGHEPSMALEAAGGARVLNLVTLLPEGDISVTTSTPAVASVDLEVVYEGGEIRYIDSVASDGSEAICVPRVEAEVTLRLASEDAFFDAALAGVLVAQVGEEGLEAPTLTREIEDLAELGSVEFVEIQPADPSALVFAASFVFSTEGVTGELGGVASYEQAGIDGDVAVSAHPFSLFAFSE